MYSCGFCCYEETTQGRIINIGSLAGKIGEDNRTAYCAAKWGLEGLTAALSVEMLKYNIHVQSLQTSQNLPFCSHKINPPSHKINKESSYPHR